ncbi:tetratricopeptide repeat protein [Fretibacter rubidus]|uniref:tetratricopeptide repeat protein n=1 Tax=Fretibacter rubidus TaxID=570162 RepID=UPI00352A952A
MRVGQANVDFDGLVITSEAGQFNVEPKVMDVLRHLVNNAGIVISRSDLIDAVWGVSYGGDERLSRAISLLRKALGDSRGTHHTIQTISRRGYKLVADIDAPKEIAPLFNPSDATPSPSASSTIEIEPTSPLTSDLAGVSGASIASQTHRFKRSAIWLSGVGALALIGAVFLWAPMSPFGIKSSGQENASYGMGISDGLKHIENFAQDGALANAQAIFSTAIASDSDNAAAHAGLALSLIRQYTFAERDPALLKRARAAAQSAMRIDDKLALSNAAMGWVYEFEADFDAAQEAYKRADILDPDNVFALEGRIRTLRKQGKRQDAYDLNAFAIEHYPLKPVFYSFYGADLVARDEFLRAEGVFRKLIDLSPGNARAYGQLAHAVHMQDRTSEAIQILQDGLLINQSDLLYNNLGTYLFFQGHYAMAADAFERTLSFEGNTHEYLYWANYADAARYVPERKDKANAAYDRALQLLQVEWDKRPNNVTLTSRAALYNAKRGNVDMARSILERLSMTEETSSVVLYRAAVAYEILTERKLALSTLKKALEAGYPLTEVLNDPDLSDLRQDMDYHFVLTAIRP